MTSMNDTSGYTTIEPYNPITVGRDENGSFTFSFPNGTTEEEKEAWIKEFYEYLNSKREFKFGESGGTKCG